MSASALVVLLLALALPAPRAAAQGNQGTYTTAQADSGAKVFAMHCAACHPPGFHSSEAFKQKWSGKTLGALFAYMRREMPKAEPGGLADEEYAQLTAYLARLNKMPSGPKPLPADSAALAKHLFAPGN